MKNNYIIIGILAVVALGIAFAVGSKKSGEPQVLNTDTGSSTALASGVYAIDTEKSIIKWMGEYINGVQEKGTLAISKGEVTLSLGAVVAGSFNIDMTSIKDQSGNVMLENYLKSESFFSAEEFPTAVFVAKRSEPSGKEGAQMGRYIIAGDLTVKGITKPISFPLNLAFADGEVHASSTFAINRTEWEVNYNSPSLFKDLGDMAIRDAILIELDLVANKIE